LLLLLVFVIAVIAVWTGHMHMYTGAMRCQPGDILSPSILMASWKW